MGRLFAATPPARGRCRFRRAVPLALALAVIAGVAAGGCQQAGMGEGPGHRQQYLRLTPHQEYSLGKQAYEEILQKNRSKVIPADSGKARRVADIGRAIARQAMDNTLLQREINLHVKDYRFDWDFTLLDDDEANAFCLPGGFVVVYTGIFPYTQDDAQLAAVLGHEIAHALAHHANERITRAHMFEPAVNAINGAMSAMPDGERKKLIMLLGAGSLGELSFDRQMESEADHIGCFLMTFAGYDPDEAIRFWENMAQRKGPRPPEILSDHPSDARRIQQLRHWVGAAKAAKQAYLAGNVAPTGPGR